MSQLIKKTIVISKVIALPKTYEGYGEPKEILVAGRLSQKEAREIVKQLDETHAFVEVIHENTVRIISVENFYKHSAPFEVQEELELDLDPPSDII